MLAVYKWTTSADPPTGSIRATAINFTERKKWSHFDLKSWVTGGTQIRPGIPRNWRIFESNWLDIESQLKKLRIFESNWLDIESQFKIWLSISSQFDWNTFQLLGIPGRILVPQVTQLYRSKWLHFFFRLIGDSAWGSGWLHHCRNHQNS